MHTCLSPLSSLLDWTELDPSLTYGRYSKKAQAKCGDGLAMWACSKIVETAASDFDIWPEQTLAAMDSDSSRVLRFTVMGK